MIDFFLSFKIPIYGYAIYYFERKKLSKVEGLSGSVFFAIFFILLNFSHPAFGNPYRFLPDGKNAVKELKHDINAILKNTLLKKNKMGIEVYSLWKKEDIFELNKNKMFTPASNLKIITAASALFFLKPEYVFKTEISTNGKFSNGHIYGNLYIKGYGDPFLTREEVWKIAQALKGKGVRFIHGDIIGDSSYFDKKVLPDSWGNKKRAMKYGGEISALSANFNTIIVNYEPGEKANTRPHIWLEPETSFVTLNNKALTRSRRKRFTLNISGIRKKRVVASGSIPLRFPSRSSLRKVSNAPLFATTLLYDLLSRGGVDILGKPRTGIASCENKIVYTHSSRKLSSIIMGMNKFSNNFIAEQILKALGAKIKGNPGTFENGVLVLRDFIDKIGGDVKKIRAFDGSGLSRKNLISPNNIVRTLEFMHNTPTYSPEFMSSLPIAGVDGTIKKRLMFNLTRRNVRAKTGTINHVSALSGYLSTRDGEPLAFSMLMNGFRVSEESVQLIQDKICYILANFSRFDRASK